MKGVLKKLKDITIRVMRKFRPIDSLDIIEKLNSEQREKIIFEF